MSKINKLKMTARKLAAELDSLNATIAQMGRFKTEPPERSVLLFEKVHGAGHVFTYAALRIGDKWYLTCGNVRHMPRTWDSLTDFIGDGPCAQASEWVQIDGGVDSEEMGRRAGWY